MMLTKHMLCLALLVAVPIAWSGPLSHDIDHNPLAAVSELNARVASRAGLLQGERDPRFPLPSTQDLETIRKVAQILITLGEQVLPSVFSERSAKSPIPICESTPQAIPNDALKDK